MEEAGDPPFHWQPPTTVVYRRRRPPSPPLFDSSLAIVILPCLALLFLFFLIHNYNQKPVQTVQYSYSPQNYPHPIQHPIQIQSPPAKPTAFSFRRSWDSLNVILIVAAILCGVLARRNEDPPAIPPSASFGAVQSGQNVRSDYPNQFPFSGCQHQHLHHLHQQQLQHQQWFQSGENRRVYGVSPRRSFGGGGGMQPELGGGRLRRTSSAYPDFMREEASIWEEENRRLRFFDDFGINSVYSSDELNYARNLDEQAPAATIDEDRSGDGDGIEIKEIPVDDFAESTEDAVVEACDAEFPAAPVSPAPPPPPPPPVSRSETKRIFQSVPRKEKVKKPIRQPTEPPPPPLPPPPTPPREPLQLPEKKPRRKKSNTTKEIAMVLASLYGHGKRKRKHQKKSNNRDDPLSSGETASQQQFPPPSPPAPPPPPPPPPSVFNFFKKSSKIKKIHSVTSAPPPPPPPPRRPPRQKSQIPVKPSSELPISDPPARRSTNPTSRKPPLPARRSNYYDNESPRINSGSLSPLVQIPAPPPLPPFGIPEMKFSVVRGGEFVRVLSAQSSRAGSPELEDAVDLTTTTSSNVDESRPSVESEINGRDSSGPNITCPSPDVNAKADTFIARHHSGWRLEKINSWKEKRMGQGP